MSVEVQNDIPLVDENNNGIITDDLIKKLEADGVTHDELLQIQKSRESEGEKLSEQSKQALQEYEKQVSKELLVGGINIPDHILKSEESFTDFYKKVCEISGLSMCYDEATTEKLRSAIYDQGNNIEKSLKLDPSSGGIMILQEDISPESVSNINFDENLLTSQTENKNLNTTEVQKSKTEKLQLIIDGFEQNTYKGVVISIEGDKCKLMSKESGQYTHFTIENPENKDFLTTEGLQGLVDKKLNDWGEIKAEQARKEATDRITRETLEQYKVNDTIDHIDNIELSELDADNSETFDMIEDLASINDTASEKKPEENSFIENVGDSITETYDAIKQKIFEFLVNFPDAGIINLGDGDTLEVEYDQKNNKLFIDTQFFDGIYDYETGVNIEIQENMSEAEIKAAIENANKELKEEYLGKLEEVKSKKQVNENLQDITEIETIKSESLKKLALVAAGKKEKEVLESFDIDIDGKDKNVDVKIRNKNGNIYIYLNTPYGDGIGDFDFQEKLLSNGEQKEYTEKDLQKQIDIIKDKYNTEREKILEKE